jgi:hypothetical protein
MENGRMNDYTPAELMAAILNVHETMGFGFSRVDERFAEQDKKIEHLRNDMTRRFDLVDDRFDRVDERFDRMDERFDRLEGRVAALEPHDHRPAS